MAVTYGFYNSINKDRVYNAMQISSIFDGVISDGVYQGVPSAGDFLKVRAGTGMQVIVGPGRAWFKHTWTLNDNDLPITIREAPIAGSRIDAIVLKIDNSDAVRQNDILVYEGVPSDDTPVKPTFDNSDAPYYYVLAYVTVAYGTSAITEDMIENVVGTDQTPFVAGVVQQVSVSELLTQWDAQWKVYFNKEQADWKKHINDTETEWDNYVTDKEIEIQELLNAFRSWTGSSEVEFLEWFQNLEDQLDDNQAAHLQNEIDELKEIMIPKNNHMTKVKTKFGIVDQFDIYGNHDNSVVTFESNRDEYKIIEHITSKTCEYQIVLIFDHATNVITKNYIYISGDREEFDQFVDTETQVYKDQADLISEMDTSGEDYARRITFQTTSNITKWTDKKNDDPTIDIIYDKGSEVILISKEVV